MYRISVQTAEKKRRSTTKSGQTQQAISKKTVTAERKAIEGEREVEVEVVVARVERTFERCASNRSIRSEARFSSRSGGSTRSIQSDGI